MAVATAIASAAAGGSSGGGGREEGEAGEDHVDVRLCSPALSARPALLQSVTGERFASLQKSTIHIISENEAAMPSRATKCVGHTGRIAINSVV